MTASSPRSGGPDGQEDILKPLEVEEYNKNMGGIDTGKNYTQCDMYMYIYTKHNYVPFLNVV